MEYKRKPPIGSTVEIIQKETKSVVATGTVHGYTPTALEDHEMIKIDVKGNLWDVMYPHDICLFAKECPDETC